MTLLHQYMGFILHPLQKVRLLCFLRQDQMKPWLNLASQWWSLLVLMVPKKWINYLSIDYQREALMAKMWIHFFLQIFFHQIINLFEVVFIKKSRWKNGKVGKRNLVHNKKYRLYLDKFRRVTEARWTLVCHLLHILGRQRSRVQISARVEGSVFNINKNLKQELTRGSGIWLIYRQSPIFCIAN